MVKYNSKGSERKKTYVLTPFHSLTPKLLKEPYSG